MGSTFGKVFRVSTFGSSHGKVVEAIVDGCPAGSELEEGIVRKQLDRRKPGQNKITKNRSKADTIEILSRLFGAKPPGTSIGLLV